MVPTLTDDQAHDKVQLLLFSIVQPACAYSVLLREPSANHDLAAAVRELQEG